MFKRKNKDEEKDRTRLVSGEPETVSGAALVPASAHGSVSPAADAGLAEEAETPVLNGAPFGPRFRAAIADHLLVFAIVFICGLPVGFAVLTYAATGYIPEGQSDLSLLGGQFLACGASLLFPFVYFAGFESSWMQATPGKLLFGLRVTGEDGRRFSRSHGFAKALAQFGFLLFAGLIASVPFGIANQLLYDEFHMWTAWGPLCIFGVVDLAVITALTCLPFIKGRTVLDLVARKQVVLASELAKIPESARESITARSHLGRLWSFSTGLLGSVTSALVCLSLLAGLYIGADYCARWWQASGPFFAAVEEGLRLEKEGEKESARVLFNQAKSKSKTPIYPYLMAHGASRLFLPLPQIALYFTDRELAVGEPGFHAGSYRWRAEALEALGRKEEARDAYEKVLEPCNGADDKLTKLARQGLKRLQ